MISTWLFWQELGVHRRMEIEQLREKTVLEAVGLYVVLMTARSDHPPALSP